MAKFIVKLLLFIGIFLIFDKAFIIVANSSAETEVDKRLEYLVKGEINKDIVIIGSSRGARDIIAGQIEIETGLSTYNLCYPGSNVEFHEFILRTLVEFNDIPDVVFLVVDDDTEFKYNKTVTFRKDRLYPLIKYSSIWKEQAERENRNTFYSRFLILNRLNKHNFDLRKKKFTALDTILDCGSMPISWQATIRDRNLTMNKGVYSSDNELIEYVDAYNEIMEICGANDISLVVVFPPLLRTHSKSFENRIKGLYEEGVHYLIYDAEKLAYKNKDFYHDGGHLILEGAQIFTSEVVEYIDDLAFK